MKAQTPYWPLFRNELGIDHGPRIPWAMGFGSCLALWLVASFLPLLLLFKSSKGDLGFFFAAFGDLVGFAMMWWLAITGWLFAFALLPGISNPLQAVRAFEFMFTRAIDRRKLFQTRLAVIYLMMLGPLLLNIIVAADMPQSAFGPDDQFFLDAANPRREQHRKALPPINSTGEELPVQTALMLVPHGEVVLTAWVFWLAALGLLFMQGYCGLLARHVQNNPWLAGLAIGVPVLVALFLAQWIPRHHPHLYEEGFLFFARNTVSLVIGLLAIIPFVQLFSERKFKQLEIL